VKKKDKKLKHPKNLFIIICTARADKNFETKRNISLEFFHIWKEHEYRGTYIGTLFPFLKKLILLPTGM
jgi:hypothetical protein